MWRRTAWSLIVGICVSLQLQADLSAQVVSRPPSLLYRTNAAQFEIVLGRITATNIRPGPARAQTLTAQSATHTESLTIGTQGQSPTLHYEFVSAEERLVIDVSRKQEVLIHRVPAEPAVKDFESHVAEVAFQQDAAGKVRLAVSSAGSTHEYTAPSVWHLALNEPLATRIYMIPLIEMLRPSWDLSHTANDLRQALLRYPAVHTLPERAQIEALVTRLGHKEFKQRQAADRELRRIGPIAIPYLKAIDPLTLDNEQRSRLRGIQESTYQTTTGDSLEKVVGWLAADRAIWLTFMADEDPQVRRTAATHLANLTGRDLEFEPMDPGAAREVQLAKLRKLLVRD